MTDIFLKGGNCMPESATEALLLVEFLSSQSDVWPHSPLGKCTRDDGSLPSVRMEHTINNTAKGSPFSVQPQTRTLSFAGGINTSTPFVVLSKNVREKL